MKGVSVISLEKIDGHERRQSGGYVPTKASIRKVLDRCMIPPEPVINYLPQREEIQSLEIYKKRSKSVLLVGPTGVGKSMLVRYMAQRWRLPFLRFTCHPDETEGKMMGKPDLMFATIEINGEARMVHFQRFVPSNISFAGLSEKPVVLFIDELHKLRRDMEVLFHSVLNEREVNLSDHLGPGEIYRLHDETMVIFALNPFYEGGGIERVSPAMKQRVKIITFEMVTDPDRLLQIVEANLGKLDKKTEGVAKRICEMCASLCKVYLEYKKKSVVSTTDNQTMEVKSKIKNVLSNIDEAPSSRLVVDTVDCILGGMNPATAVLEGIFDQITVDPGSATTRALRTIAEDVYGIK